MQKNEISKLQFFYQYMKNLNQKASTGLLRQRKMEQPNTAPKVHQRGDKVVVNGAKESLLSILKRHICDCGKHTGDVMILKFLKNHKITASYDVMVWMFIFMRLNCQQDLYLSITNEYLMKMHKKNQESQNHKSQKYKITKKKTIQKFIESAKMLITDSVNKKAIQNSITALYSKGKSKENALDKIDLYLKEINFESSLEFISGSCSLTFRDKQPQNLKLAQQCQSQQEKTLKLTSDNSEDEISQKANPLQENTYEDGEMLEDYESMSYWCSSSKETYDLFEELIQNKDLDGLQSNY